MWTGWTVNSDAAVDRMLIAVLDTIVEWLVFAWGQRPQLPDWQPDIVETALLTEQDKERQARAEELLSVGSGIVKLQTTVEEQQSEAASNLQTMFQQVMGSQKARTPQGEEMAEMRNSMMEEMTAKLQAQEERMTAKLQAQEERMLAQDKMLAQILSAVAPEPTEGASAGDEDNLE